MPWLRISASTAPAGEKLDKPMAWFEDGAPCNYFGRELTPCLRAVGWLAKPKPFTTGPLDQRVYDKLQELREGRQHARWIWLLQFMFIGRHECDFCSGPDAAWCSMNLLIPGRGFLFVAPDLILHYMEAHDYRPPPEFCQAVLDCPPVPSTAYLEAISANEGNAAITT